MLAHPLHYINPSRILQLDSRLGCWKVTPRWRSGHRARRRRRHHHSQNFLLLLILLLQQQQRLQLKHETPRKPSSAGAVCSAGSGNRNRRARSAGEPSGQYGSYGQYIVIRTFILYCHNRSLFLSLHAHLNLRWSYIRKKKILTVYRVDSWLLWAGWGWRRMQWLFSAAAWIYVLERGKDQKKKGGGRVSQHSLYTLWWRRMCGKIYFTLQVTHAKS